MVLRAQGLVHLGKGTIGINPFHTDRSLMSPVAVAGLLATIVAFTDTTGCEFAPIAPGSARLCLLTRSGKNAVIFDKSHWMLYFIVMAMYPVRPPSPLPLLCAPKTNRKLPPSHSAS